MIVKIDKLEDYKEIEAGMYKYNLVEIIIHIKQVVTGEIVKCKPSSSVCDDHGLFTYYFEDGNMQCSCNRASKFDNEKGINVGEDKEYECGDDDYLINIFNPKTGNCVYSEFEEEI